jgi:hypothetical protein
MSSQSRVEPHPVIQHSRASSNTSLAVIRGRYLELLPTTVATPSCMLRFHTFQGWEMVQCSEVLVFLLFQTFSCPLQAKPLDTHDPQLQTPRVSTSCLHNSLGMILWPLGYLECDCVTPRSEK